LALSPLLTTFQGLPITRSDWLQLFMLAA
jgi:hypothetical protein